MLSSAFYSCIQKLTTAIFWAVTQHVVVITYRRFGRIWYPDRLSRNVGKEFFNTRFVMTHNTAVITHFAAEG